jgi:hypothetical protein
MPPKSIGIIPAGGYRNKERHSNIGIQWLLWLEASKSIQIQHARNGGEVKFGRMTVDGYDAVNKTIYEFLGCFYHGCPHCYKSDEENPQLSCTMGELLEKTNRRLASLQTVIDADAAIVTIWECQFRHQKTSNEAMRAFLEAKSFVEPLMPKDGFFGGRTQPTRLHYKAREDEAIRYLDYVSLYPTVNKYDKMPAGHPELILAPPNYSQGQYFGMVKCRVLPPTRLYHPVLPYKSKGKLLFPLCRTCADVRAPEENKCNHTPDERAILGTWVSTELDLALDKGYQVLNVFEVWHYPKTLQLDVTSKDAAHLQKRLLFVKQ